MTKKIFLGIILLLFAAVSYAQEAQLVRLKGITVDMRKKDLVDNWGFPSKREYRRKLDVWYYPNENTAHPTDGIVVYLKKGRVESWKVVDNLFEEMKIWGKGPGLSDS